MIRVERFGLGNAIKRFIGASSTPELSVGEDLLPVLNAWNLDDPPYAAKGGGIFSSSLAAGAGIAAGMVGVPAGSEPGDRLVVRFALALLPGASDWIYAGVIDAAEAAVATQRVHYSWDQATLGGPSVQGRGDARSGNTLPSSTDGLYLRRAQASALIELPGPIVVGPGQYFSISTGAPLAIEWTIYYDYYEG